MCLFPLTSPLLMLLGYSVDWYLCIYDLVFCRLSSNSNCNAVDTSNASKDKKRISRIVEKQKCNIIKLADVRFGLIKRIPLRHWILLMRSCNHMHPAPCKLTFCCLLFFIKSSFLNISSIRVYLKNVTFHKAFFHLLRKKFLHLLPGSLYQGCMTETPTLKQAAAEESAEVSL